MSDGDEKRAQELVCAIAHEVGNALGGIRMQAHLLDDELAAHEIASASVSLDALASRAAPLLSLVRPLLTPQARRSPASSYAGVLEAVCRELEQDGTRGVRLLRACSPEAAQHAPPAEWLHALLRALVGASLERLAAGGEVRLACAADSSGSGRGWAVSIEDDGPPEDLLEDSALRGRPLAVAIARELVGRLAGRVEVGAGSTGAGTRLVLRLPELG